MRNSLILASLFLWVLCAGPTTVMSADIDRGDRRFGFIVAAAGDVNGDRYADVIVTANRRDQREGSRVYVFHGSSSGLSFIPNWVVETDRSSGSTISVASAGDVNRDGYSDIIVGIQDYDDGKQQDAGKAVVYLGSPSGLESSPAWSVVGDQAGGRLGHSVAAAGDVNGDGFPDVVVGADSYNNREKNEGRILVYPGSPVGLSTTAKWVMESNQYGAMLGASVSAAGDVNGDGFDDIGAGAPGCNARRGCAFVYFGSRSGPQNTPGWIGEGDRSGDEYGNQVAAAGDVNHDGYSDIIISSKNSHQQKGEGRAYLYLGSSAGPATSPAWTVTGDQAGADTGIAVASAGDRNGDGYNDVVVGANLFHNAQTEEGRILVYFGDASSLSGTPSWTAEGNQTGARLGSSVAFGGDINGDGYSDLIAGAPGYSGKWAGEGRIFVFYGSARNNSASDSRSGESANTEDACLPPGLAVSLYSVTRDASGNTILHFTDPNLPAEVTGYNIYRSSTPYGPWIGVGANSFDMDSGTANIQWVDSSGDPGDFFYEVAAFNSTCPAEGPWLSLFDLSITRSGTGSGVVTSEPSGMNCGAQCLGQFAPNAPVSLTATPDATSTFAGWSGACTGTGACNVTMSGPVSVTATFTRITFVLTASHNGGGTVTSNPAGINCGATCSDSFAAATTVTLTATPNAGNAFAGWSGACTGTGTCDVTMTSAKSVSARFTTTVTQTLSGNGGGLVTSNPAGINCGTTCLASFDVGTTVTLTPASDASSSFTGWYGGYCTGTSTCILILDGPLSVTAEFQLNTFLLTASHNGGGIVASNPAGINCGATCSARFEAGTVVTLTATPNSGNTFTGWAGTCTGTGTCTVTMNAAKFVSANFTTTLTQTLTGTGGGSVTSNPAGINCGATCVASFNVGTSVTLTASPDATSIFMGWTGPCTVTGTQCTVTMSGPISVTAAFTRTTVTVTIVGGGGGTVNSSPAGIINCGATCTAAFTAGGSVQLTASPAGGFSFSGWTGACTGTGNTCDLLMNGPKNVTAVFVTLLSVTRTSISGGNGTVTSNPSAINCGTTCSVSLVFGTSVVLTATPDATSIFTGWSGNCTGTGTCNVTMNGPVSVAATFTRTTVTVTFAGGGGGTVNSSPAGINCGATCTAAFTAGGSVQLTQSPASGSTFIAWTGCDSISGGTCNLLMNGPKSVTAAYTTPLSVTRSSISGGDGTVTSNPGGINCGTTCSASFNFGTSVVLTATPDATSTFTGWSGPCTGTGTCNVTMNGSVSVVATFTGITLTVSHNGGGTVTSNPAGINCGATCSASFTTGTLVTLTAAPSAGNAFARWSGACTGTGTCDVTMTSAKSVSANFITTLTQTLTGTGGGSVSSNPAGINCGTTCAASFNIGASVTLTATPDATSTFTGWSGACTGTGTCNVTMNGPVSVTATFTRITFLLTVNQNGGTVTSNPAGINCGATCSASFTTGTTVTLTAAPSAGNTFIGWNGAGCSGTGTCTVTMTSAKTVSARFTTTLTQTLSGTGGGSVTSNPAGINCGATCTASFDVGTIVTLTATPNANSTFTGWTGACSGTGACTPKLNGPTSVGATFTAN